MTSKEFLSETEPSDLKVRFVTFQAFFVVPTPKAIPSERPLFEENAAKFVACGPSAHLYPHEAEVPWQQQQIQKFKLCGNSKAQKRQVGDAGTLRLWPYVPYQMHPNT